MAKINIKSKLHNKTDNIDNIKETSGILLNNRIKYKDDDITVTLVIKNNTIEMIRSSIDYELTMHFDENNSYSKYLLKENNLNLDIDMNTEYIKIEENKIEINYTVDCEYIFTLEYSEKE